MTTLTFKSSQYFSTMTKHGRIKLEFRRGSVDLVPTSITSVVVGEPCCCCGVMRHQNGFRITVQPQKNVHQYINDISYQYALRFGLFEGQYYLYTAVTLYIFF